MKQRIVIAGLGDTGLLVAIHLARDYDVVGISPKPCLVSGQELGARLTRPDVWQQDYLMPFARYEKLDGARTIHGGVARVDAAEQRVRVTLPDGSERIEAYDALVISSGVRNGFWRNDALEDVAGIRNAIADAASQMAGANTIAIIGGGATGVSVAGNLAQWAPDKAVHLFYHQDQPLPGYHPKTRTRLEGQLKKAGVRLYPNHRAAIPKGFQCDRLTREPVAWSSGQPPFEADLTLWAVGRARPNSAFLPADMLDEEGFVRVDDTLRVPSYTNVFAVGDIAASDPNRSSARNWGHRVVAHNVRALLSGNEADMKRFEAPSYRWGSILGVQRNGLQVYQPDGRSFRFPSWVVEKLLFPIAVRRGIYKGVRRAAPN